MTDFVCTVDEKYRSACEGLDCYGEHEGKRYCVLHLPSKVKTDTFEQIVERKLGQKDFDFRGTVFPIDASNFEKRQFDADAKFNEATFHGKAAFSEATFKREADFANATFKQEADFANATFRREADFFEVTFKGAAFQDATFLRSAKFVRATFSATSDISADFHRATFTGELYFRETKFCGHTDFHRASFMDAVKFIGYEEPGAGNPPNRVFCLPKRVNFTRARIDKPELFSFDTVQLRPSWFINVDARKFDFTDVKWCGMIGGPEGTLDEEILALEDRGIESPHTLLAQACRRLSANAEESREYPLANDFHYWSMNARRIESSRSLGLRSLGLIGTLYWALSGYGVRPRRALVALLIIALFFAVLYMFVGCSSLQVLPIVGMGQVLADTGQAVMYSIGVMARLRPEPIPKEMGWFQIMVTVEGILGPLQIALLALAIRRQVMR